MNQEAALLETFKILESDNMASIDPNGIIYSEEKRLPMDAEVKTNQVTPLFPLFPSLVRAMEDESVKSIIIDGTGTHYCLHTLNVDGEQESVTTVTAEEIANTRPIPGKDLKNPIAQYFMTYYLLRYYLLGGTVKYAISKLDEGFAVFANDPENPSVWAKHKVVVTL